VHAFHHVLTVLLLQLLRSDVQDIPLTDLDLLEGLGPEAFDEAERDLRRLLEVLLLLERTLLEERDIYDVVEECVRLGLIRADDDSPEEVARTGVVD